MFTIDIKHIILTLVLVFLSCGNIAAQRKSVKSIKKAAAKAETDNSSILLEDMLPATAKIIIIDSVVCDQDKIIDNIPLAKECGKIMSYEKFFNKQTSSTSGFYAYVNEFEDKCFYKDSLSNRNSVLYTAEKLQGKWQNKRIINEFGTEYEDINYPYLMPDGVTLYFSARDKNNTFGGRDIYMTRLNTDSMRFYKPENIGLPYNSSADDYCCIIDDINSLGWLATNRNQPKGKVCIYTFIPSDKRWIDDNANLPNKKLEALAHISNIKDTWYDKKAIEDARTRLSDIKNRKKENNKGNKFLFIVNDRTIYRSLSDFKSPTGKKLFTELLSLKKNKENEKNALDEMRIRYSKSSNQEKKSLAANILKAEKEILSKEQQIQELEIKIRNAENL